MRPFFALMAALVLVSALPAGAAEKKRGATAGTAADKPAAKAPADAGDAPGRAPRAARAAPKPPAPPPGRAADTGAADASARGPSPRKPRVYTFSGLDVEGKLKTPQLLYFRSRVKQELDTSTPEKRSFMKELEASAGEPGL
jgi:hypothetical protein